MRIGLERVGGKETVAIRGYRAIRQVSGYSMWGHRQAASTRWRDDGMSLEARYTQQGDSQFKVLSIHWVHVGGERSIVNGGGVVRAIGVEGSRPVRRRGWLEGWVDIRS